MKNKEGSFASNLLYAMIAQIISLLLSISMSLLVPKVLGVREYSYWQLFLFYITYTGFFHFGINDGMYLRLGGKKYDEIDFPLLKGQFFVLTLFQVLISFIICLFAFKLDDPNRIFVCISTSIYMILFNLSGYVGYMFQAVNNTKVYSKSIMIDKVVFLICVIFLLLNKTDVFLPYICFYIFSKAISLVYLLVGSKELIFAKTVKIRESIKEAVYNASIGIKLLLANIASLLIIGVGRFIIDWLWGIETFGKLSFSLSLTNFFLLFVSQVSMVLFPALRRIDEKSQYKVYNLIRDGLSIALPLVFLGYVPIKIIVSIWLPNYNESIRYLALLLPLCTFDAKMQMLCNTYFKVLRKEDMLLKINVISMILSVILCLIGGFVFRSVPVIALFMVVAVAFRSIISEIYLSKIMGRSIVKELLGEIILSFSFIFVFWFFSDVKSFVLFLVCYIVFLIFRRNSVKNVIIGLKKRN